jgi:CSLREA domain-containing protein
MNKKIQFFYIFVIVSFMVGMVGVSEAKAYVLVRVNQLTDEYDGACTLSHCTLREAIEAAQDGNVIRFESALSGQTIMLQNPLVFQKNITVDGSTLANHIIISTDYRGMDFVVSGDYVVSFISLDLTGTYYGDMAGALENYGGVVIIHDVNFYENMAESGAAIGNYVGGTITITDSTFTNNVAYDGSGGAIYNAGGSISITDSEFSGNEAVYRGGAIASNPGSISVENCSFANNQAGHRGGAIYLDGTIFSMVNSTLFSNDAGSDANNIFDSGGGIFADENAVLSISNSTFSHNRAEANGGGIFLNINAVLNFSNTILANSTNGYDCYNNRGSIATNVGNLIEQNAAGTNACGVPAVVLDPALGRITDNGGPTRTMSISSTSPAIDAGDNAVCESTDQRGYPRPVDGDNRKGATCDIGAYEAQ